MNNTPGPNESKHATPMVEINTSIAVNGLPLSAGKGFHHNHELVFEYLPRYAKFLLEHKVEDLAKEMLAVSKQMDWNVLKLLDSFSDQQLLEMTIQSVKKSLGYLAANQTNLLIEDSIRGWINNELPQLSRDAIGARDITIASFIRRKAFRDFLNVYSEDVHICTRIMEEVDAFTNTLETISLNFILERQQGLYKQAQSLAHIGTWVWDLRGDQLIWSEELYKIYELEPGSKLDRKLIGDFNHPDDAEMVLQQMSHSNKTREPHDFFYRIILSNGKQKILHAKGQVIVDEHDEPGQMFGTLQDVTEQKLKENELSENKNFIQRIADITPSLITAYNVQTGKYIFINDALKKILGYEPKKVLENGVAFFIEILHPDDFPIVMAKNQRALEKANRLNAGDPESIEEFEYRLKNSKGEYRWFHTYGTVFSRDNKGQVEYVLNISVDVTEEHLLQVQIQQEKAFIEQRNEELRRSEERYHNMIAEVKDYLIILLDVDGTVQNWNQGAEKIKGYKAEEVIGKNFRIFYTAEDREKKRPERLLQTAIQTGQATDEGWRVRKDGSLFWSSIVITALHDEQNNVIGFSKVTRDLTEKRKAEEKLKEYAERLKEKNDELERSNKELESFNYAASHDLQEPLRKIQIFANAILTSDAETLSTKAKEYFNRMNLAANRMQQLIEDLLMFSRATISTGEYQDVDLNILFEESLSALRASIDESGAVIEKQKLPVARVIPFQFTQLFQNLIGNSLKYRKPGEEPHIKITTKTLAKNNIKELSPDRKYIKITIADNGIGFEQFHSEKIFDLFQRLHTKDEFPGTGIGLAICKKIIQNHHGIIKAKGKPQQGAKFDIYIPAG